MLFIKVILNIENNDTISFILKVLNVLQDTFQGALQIDFYKGLGAREAHDYSIASSLTNKSTF